MCFLKQYKSASYITFINLFTRLCCFVLVLQVCEERLQFSLSENVKTNVLWGSTVKDTVMLRPWGEQITENSTEEVTVKEQKRINKEQQEDERYEEEDLQNKIVASGGSEVFSHTDHFGFIFPAFKIFVRLHPNTGGNKN